SLLVKVAEVAGLEPAIHKSLLGFLGHVPVALEDRGTANQDFAVVGYADFYVLQRLADGPQLVLRGRVDRHHGRSFRQAVAFVYADADAGKPFRQLAPQRRASGKEDLGS